MKYNNEKLYLHFILTLNGNNDRVMYKKHGTNPQRLFINAERDKVT